MKCPRCGTKMKIDIKITIEGKKITIYYCPNCGEMGHSPKH